MFLGSEEIVEYYMQLKKDHPALISMEDPLDEKVSIVKRNHMSCVG